MVANKVARQRRRRPPRWAQEVLSQPSLSHHASGMYARARQDVELAIQRARDLIVELKP
jgi:hypothetical protein